MKNFSVIVELRLIRFKYCQIPSSKLSLVRLSDIVTPGQPFELVSGIKPHSCSFSEVEKSSEAGSYFEKKLKFEISQLRPGVSELLDRYANNQIVAIITDANGYSHLVYPLLRSVKRELPGTAKGANVTEVEFSGKGLYEAPFVDINS